MMKQVCEKLNIQVNKVIDHEKNEVEIAGCTEIKGIRGTDKRAYFVDIQGITPRDANYMGDDNHTCLVRQEMLHLYHRSRQFEHAKTNIADFDKQNEADFKEKLLEFTFNNNVFKKVQLAMTPEEIKAEEDKLIDLASYISSKGLTDCISNLGKNEGTPTDSASLKDFLH
jgi:hypothetical protein